MRGSAENNLCLGPPQWGENIILPAPVYHRTYALVRWHTSSATYGVYTTTLMAILCPPLCVCTRLQLHAQLASSAEGPPTISTARAPRAKAGGRISTCPIRSKKSGALSLDCGKCPSPTDSQPSSSICASRLFRQNGEPFFIFLISAAHVACVGAGAGMISQFRGGVYSFT